MANSQDDDGPAGNETGAAVDEAAGAADGRQKLVPEWSVNADDQVVLAGLALIAAFLVVMGWNHWHDDGATNGATAVVVNEVAMANDLATKAGVPAGSVDDDGTPSGESETAAPATTAPATTALPTTALPTTAAPTTASTAADLSPGVAAAVAGLAGATGTVDGTVAVLDGFVGTEVDRTEAGDRAAAVEGVTAVDNQLVVLDSLVLASLDATKVTSPTVEMSDIDATIRGSVADEAAREVTVAAAASVPGVRSVIDELTITPDVTTELNALLELEPIQFATASAEILPASFSTLDRAVAILADNTTSTLELQGYTDTRGSADRNLALSQARADAVTTYLIDRGIAGDTLVAVGYGETSTFAEGDSDEALAANRRVRFELV